MLGLSLPFSWKRFTCGILLLIDTLSFCLVILIGLNLKESVFFNTEIIVPLYSGMAEVAEIMCLFLGI